MSNGRTKDKDNNKKHHSHRLSLNLGKLKGNVTNDSPIITVNTTSATTTSISSTVNTGNPSPMLVDSSSLAEESNSGPNISSKTISSPSSLRKHSNLAGSGSDLIFSSKDVKINKTLRTTGSTSNESRNGASGSNTPHYTSSTKENGSNSSSHRSTPRISFLKSSTSSHSTSSQQQQKFLEDTYSFNELCNLLILKPDNVSHRYIHSITNDKLHKMHDNILKQVSALKLPKDTPHASFNTLFDANFVRTDEYSDIVLVHAEANLSKMQKNAIYLQILDDKIKVHSLSSDNKLVVTYLSGDDMRQFMAIENLKLPEKHDKPIVISFESELFEKIRLIYTPHELITIVKFDQVDCYLVDHFEVLGKGGQGKVVIGYQYPNVKVSTEKYRDNLLLASIAIKILNDTLDEKMTGSITKTLHTYAQYENDCTLEGKKGTNIFMSRIFGKALKEMLYQIDTNKNPDDPDYYVGKRYLKPEYKMNLIRELMMSLMAFHNKGYIHKDVKPENTIFLPQMKREILSFLLTWIDLDDATNQKVYTTNDCGTNPYKDPRTVCPKYKFTPMPDNLFDNSTLPKEDEIQIRFTDNGLEYRTSLCETTQLIDWDNKQMPKNFPRKLPKFNTDEEREQFYKSLKSKFRSKILNITTPKGHTGVLHSPASDCYSLLVTILEFMADENLQKDYRTNLQKKTEKEKGKKQVEINSFDASEEENYHITQEELCQYFPGIFTDKFLHETFKDLGIDNTWLNLDTHELYKILEPYLTNYLDSDKEILKNNTTDLIDEIVFRLYIVPELVNMFIQFKKEPKMPVIVKEIDSLLIKYNTLKSEHYDLYKSAQIQNEVLKKKNKVVKSAIPHISIEVMNDGQKLLTRKEVNRNVAKQDIESKFESKKIIEPKASSDLRFFNTTTDKSPRKTTSSESKARENFHKKHALRREISNEKRVVVGS